MLVIQCKIYKHIFFWTLASADGNSIAGKLIEHIPVIWARMGVNKYGFKSRLSKVNKQDALSKNSKRNKQLQHKQNN